MRLIGLALAAALAAGCAPPARGPDERAAGFALVDEAATHLEAARSVEAFRALRQAEQIAAAQRADDLRGAALTGLGDLYTALSEPDKATSHYRQALPLLERGDNQERLARALNGLAWIDLLGTRYPAAGQLLARARALRGPGPATRSTTLRLSSEVAARDGDLAAAQALVAAAVEAAGPPGSLAHARGTAQRARLAARAAAYREALELWETSLARLRDLGAPADVADALVNLGDLYFQLGLVEECGPRYEEARTVFARIADRAGEARAAVRLARVEQRRRRPGPALAHVEQALALARQRHDYVTEAEALVELGQIWIGDPVPGIPALPNPDVAERHLRAAREIYKDAGDRGAAAGVWLRTGAIQLQARRFRTAALSFAFVARTARELGDEDLLWQALRGEALALAGQDDLPAAAARFGDAIAALERVYARTAGLSQEARSSFLGDRRGIYEEYVEVLVRLRGAGGGADLERAAFTLAEQARSRQFTDSLAAGGAERATAGGDPRLRELVARERALRTDLAQLTRSLATPGAQAGDAGSVAGRMADLRRRHDETLAAIRAGFPRYAELLQPGPVTPADAQAALRAGETLVSYFVGPRLTVAFVLTRERFAMLPIPIPRPELRALADRFRRPFADLRSFQDLLAWDPADAHALYRRLIEPLAPHLAPGATLLVAGDDALYTLPLEALLLRAPAARPAPGPAPLFAEMETLDWLGDRHPIVYVPSAGALRALRGEPAPAAWRTAVVAFADPEFGEGGAAAARGLRRSGDAALARLAETAAEAQAVVRLVPGDSRVFLRREASEPRARQLDLASTRYLLFSTHGLLGGEISAVTEPALALTLVGNPADVDGFLSMSEVLALRLGADLVVLSACNTAGEPGAARLGEGFAGLTRSFMYAGARSLVVSHWPVGSQATVSLVTALFEELAAGQPKAAALARARRRLRSVTQGGVRLAHPFFWAPFVIVGEPR